MKHVLTKGLLLYLLFASLTLVANADRGPLVLTKDVTIEEPGQKAIIAYNGVEEILILGTDVKASDSTKVLEFIPFPSEPNVSLVPESFQNLETLLKVYNMKYVRNKIRRLGVRSGSGGPSDVELRFHTQLGAHDVTVVHIRDVSHFRTWVQVFFREKGFPERDLSSQEADLVRDYVDQGFSFFVFDVVEISPETRSVEPLLYRFPTRSLYYPLKTSNLFHGEGTIDFFLFSSHYFLFDWFHWHVGQDILHLERKPEISSYEEYAYSWVSSIITSVTGQEMGTITPVIPELLGEQAFLRAFRYRGPLRFAQDVWLETPTLEAAPNAPTIQIELGTEKIRYDVEDPFELRFRVSQACYPYLMFDSNDGTIGFMLPNRRFPETKIDGGTVYSTRDDFELNVRFEPPSPSIEIFNLFCSAEKIDLFDADFDDPNRFYIIDPSEYDQEQSKHLFERLMQLPQHEWGGKSVVVPMGISPMRAFPHGIGLISPVWTTETVGKLFPSSFEITGKTVEQEEEVQKIFGLDENWRPREYIENEFEDQGDVVIDHATRLMWQKSGSDDHLTYKEAQAYIEKLNHERFAGHDDWRLPTAKELMSLLEPERQANNLYINPIFDAAQSWCWSADKRSSGSAWYIGFDSGGVNWGVFDGESYVRVVRFWQDRGKSKF